MINSRVRVARLVELSIRSLPLAVPLTALLILAVVTTCSSCRNKTASKSLVSVSFETSLDYDTPQLPPFSSNFEITNFTWHPAAASSDSTYRYLVQMICLEGKSVSPPGEVSPGHKLYLCFWINDPVPYKIYADPIHPGIFPVARVIPVKPGEKEDEYLDQVSGVGLEVTQYFPGIPVGKVRKVQMLRETAEGSLEVIISEKNRLAGKVNYRDANLTISGSFDCPFHKK